MFSLFSRDKDIKIAISSMKIKFKCKHCGNRQEEVLSLLGRDNEVDFDISDTCKKHIAFYRLQCDKCKGKTDISLTCEYDESSDKGEV